MRRCLRLCLFAVGYSYTLLAQQPSAPLTAAAGTPVLVRSGSALVRFTLTNPNAAAVPLSLSLGPLADATSGALFLAPKTSFQLEAGGATLPDAIGPHESLEIIARLSEMTGTSSATLRLFNHTQPVAEWDVIALDEPMNITLAGNGTTDKPIEMVWGNKADLVLKNSSASFLTFKWTFGIDGRSTIVGKAVSMAPGGAVHIPIEPPFEAFALTDFVTASPHTAEMNLQMVSPVKIDSGLLPRHTLPVSVRMVGSNSFLMTLSSYSYVGAFLLMGGILSLLASSVLPNVLAKIDLRKQVNALANRTSSVSTRVDSYLRVLLRLERKKIDILLRNIRPWLPTAPDDLAEIGVAVTGLVNRLAVAERLDELRRHFEDICSTAPPSLSDAIDKALSASAVPLHTFILADADMAAATALLDKAESLIAMLDDNDAIARMIAANFTQLKARLKQFPEDYYKDLRAALPGIFFMLGDSFVFDDPRNIVPPMFFAVDHGIAAMQVALDYAMVRVSIPVTGSSSCADPGADPRLRLLARECRLLAMLGTLSWQSLSAAINLVQQMREDIYEGDVLEQYKKSRAHIVFDTQRARPYLPVFFSISFDDRRFNGAAALENHAIRWTFPGPLNESGRKVCHYFQGDELGATRVKKWFEKKIPPVVEAQVSPAEKPQTPPVGDVPSYAHQKKGVAVQFEAFDYNGSNQCTCLAFIEVQPPARRRERSRLWAGALRFAIAFGVALAGLESGGLDELVKLGFIQATIAIVALGFGADSIKNLLTQSTKAPVVVAPAPKPAQ
ncbi:MAG TPA: hypothetical protein VGJ21_00660 [Terracidiphilus sp.]